MAPPPRLRILSGKSSLFPIRHGTPNTESVCSGWQCDLGLFIVAPSSDDFLRRNAGLEIWIRSRVSIRRLLQVRLLSTSSPEKIFSLIAFLIDRSKAFGNERFKPRHGMINLLGPPTPPVDSGLSG